MMPGTVSSSLLFFFFHIRKKREDDAVPVLQKGMQFCRIAVTEVIRWWEEKLGSGAQHNQIKEQRVCVPNPRSSPHA